MSGRALLCVITLLVFVVIQPSRANICKIKVKTRHQQCVDIGYPVACQPGAEPFPDNHNECTALLCGQLVVPTVYKITFVNHLPLPNTECGTNKICVNEVCTEVCDEDMPEPVGSIEVERCLSRHNVATMFGGHSYRQPHELQR